MTVCQIHDNPLRVHRIVFPSECPCKVRIALPVSVLIAIGHTGVAVPVRAIVASEAATRQEIPKRMANEFSGTSIANEISFAARIAPGSPRVPMPRLNNEEFRVLAIAQGLPAS